MKWLLLFPLLQLSAFAQNIQEHVLKTGVLPATEEWHLFGRVVDLTQVDYPEGYIADPFGDSTPPAPPLSFKEWEIYHDNTVSFRYPKSSKVTIKKVPVEKTALDDTAKSIPEKESYKYQIRVGKEIALTLEYKKVEGFKDLSYYKKRHNMEHEQLRLVDKSIAKYHFLMGGVLADVQLSNDKELLICKIADAMFSKDNQLLSHHSKGLIAASMRLKSKAGKTKQQWQQLVSTRAGWKGLCSFLYKGMPYADVVTLLGKPNTNQSLDRTVWLKDGDSYPLKLEIQFDSDNKLVSLPNYGVETNYSLPLEGRIAWIENIINRESYINNLPLKKMFGEPIKSTKNTLEDDLFAEDGKLIQYFTSEVPLTPTNKKKIHLSLLKLLSADRQRTRASACYLSSQIIKEWKLDPAPFIKLVYANRIKGVAAARILVKGDKEAFKVWVNTQLETLHAKSWTHEHT